MVNIAWPNWLYLAMATDTLDLMSAPYSNLLIQIGMNTVNINGDNNNDWIWKFNMDFFNCSSCFFHDA